MNSKKALNRGLFALFLFLYFPLNVSADQNLLGVHNFEFEIQAAEQEILNQLSQERSIASEGEIEAPMTDVLSAWDNIEAIDDTQVRINYPNFTLQNKDFVVLKSKTGNIVGLFEVEDPTGKILNLLAINSDRLPQRTDYLQKYSLESESSELAGTTYLWRYKAISRKALSYYKPLFTQGATIGDTAQTLYKDEMLVSALGTIAYGAHRNISVSTNIPAFTLGSPNFRFKGRFYSGVSQHWALGVSYAQSRNSSEKLVNVDIIWDSVLSENLVAHSILSAAVVSFDEARDIAALKSYGNSSIQTGYEYIFSDWSRMIMGPNYNVEQKAIGGYLGYLKIFDTFHIQLSITTTNVREIKVSAGEGYLAFLDAYWRW